MNTKDSIALAYNRAAQAYAANFYNEFEKKHFDQVLLAWFASQVPKDETVLEIGGGPGEVSAFLSKLGVKCLSTDLCEGMIESGKKYFPNVAFEVQDFLNLTYPDQSFSNVIAYYAIVNLTLAEIRQGFAQVKRVLKDGGLFLFTFHTYEGQESVEVANFLNTANTPLTFYYFKIDEIKALVDDLGFQVVDILMRYPYPEAEYPSKRAYFILRK